MSEGKENNDNKNDVSKENDDNKEVNQSVNDNENESHDPYYPPIIVLPELIVVDNGESNEDVMFCHRAKLYRYESKLFN